MSGPGPVLVCHCSQCGAVFRRSTNGRYCSDACRRTVAAQRRAERIAEDPAYAAQAAEASRLSKRRARQSAAKRAADAMTMAAARGKRAAVDLARVTAELERRLAGGAAAVTKPQRARAYDFGGKPLTVRQLALRAGCSAQAMAGRLRRGMTPLHAVAAGAEMPAHRHPPKYTLHGVEITAAKLAGLAGCSTASMHKRLTTKSPEQAVALGPEGRTRG